MPITSLQVHPPVTSKKIRLLRNTKLCELRLTYFVHKRRENMNTKNKYIKILKVLFMTAKR